VAAFQINRPGSNAGSLARWVGAALGLGTAAILMTFGGLAALAATTVNLGTAASFAVLAGTGVTNTGSSTISGDLGTYPTAAVTGFPPGLVEAPYTTFAADSVALQAQTDLTTAYNQAAGEGPATTLTGVDLTNLTLTPGVYQSPSDGSLTINGPQNLTLSGAGVFIFQTGASQTLVTSTTSNVAYINGASPCNVFWQIGSSATLKGPQFIGTVMASTSITVGSGVTVYGRLLAGTGDVTLISDTINASTCIATASLPTPTATAPATATVPTSGAGGTSPFVGAGVLVTLGGLVLLGAGAAMGVIRRRRFPSV
jgi:hypothetical protein